MHLGDEEGSHARAGASAQGVGELEALQAVAALRLLPHNVQHRVHQLRSCTKLSELSNLHKCIINIGINRSMMAPGEEKILLEASISTLCALSGLSGSVFAQISAEAGLPCGHCVKIGRWAAGKLEQPHSWVAVLTASSLFHWLRLW